MAAERFIGDLGRNGDTGGLVSRSMRRKPSKTTLRDGRRAEAANRGSAIAAGLDAESIRLWGARHAWALAVALIVASTVAVYSNSFRGPFVFDDEVAIVKNTTIRNLAALGEVLSPPSGGETVTARPLLNLSLAVNYAISGDEVWSYHAGNLVIHLCSALLLFGIVRRTFLLPSMRQQWGSAATPIALAVALLWAVHPLQTQSVTYIVQRAESLMGLWYLLTIYCAIRGAEIADTSKAANTSEAHAQSGIEGAPAMSNAMGWYAAAALACLAGMASKEVMASAPWMVLFYDRAFLAGSFREAWRRRCGLYAAFASTWLLLGWLVISAGNRAGSVGIGAVEIGAVGSSAVGIGADVSWWAYLCTQFGAIVHYIRLCVWPHPLVLDYGAYMAKGFWAIVPAAIVVVLLALATLVALWRWPKAGILGLWFFAILAPTSSILPVCVSQTISEHRMYLPSAAVVIGVVIGAVALGRRLVRRRVISLRTSRLAGGAVLMLATIALGSVTVARNADYRSELSIWQDTVDKMPDNARARNNLGAAHNKLGVASANEKRFNEAIAHYQKVLELKPEGGEAHCNLGNVLTEQARFAEAVGHYRKALELKADFAEAYYGLGNALAGQSKFDEAVRHYRKAVELKPDFADAHCNLGNAFAAQGKFADAVGQYQKALELKPNFAEAHRNFGNALAAQDKFADAVGQYQKALELKPDFAEAHYGLGNALVGQSKFDAAIVHYREAMRLKPDDADAQNNLAAALIDAGRADEALALCTKALQVRPADARARRNYQKAVAKQKNNSAPR